MTTQTPENQTQKNFIRPAEVIEKYGISRTALYHAIQNGTIPEPVRISRKFTGWAPDQIDAAFRA